MATPILPWATQLPWRPSPPLPLHRHLLFPPARPSLSPPRYRPCGSSVAGVGGGGWRRGNLSSPFVLLLFPQPAPPRAFCPLAAPAIWDAHVLLRPAGTQLPGGWPWGERHPVPYPPPPWTLQHAPLRGLLVLWSRVEWAWFIPCPGCNCINQLLTRGQVAPRALSAATLDAAARPLAGPPSPVVSGRVGLVHSLPKV